MIVCSMQGVSMLLPIQQCMAEPEKLPVVVCWTMTACCLVQVSTAVMAYYLYGQLTICGHT